MIENDIDKLTEEITRLEERVEFLKLIRSHVRRLKKLNEIDIKYGLDKQRAAILHGDERRERAKR
jgi:ligand-binding sensor protein